jgi:hypothetical protein
MRLAIALLSLLAAVLFCRAAGAHGMRTALLDVTETGPGRAVMVLGLPTGGEGIDVQLPDGCKVVDSARSGERTSRSSLECDAPLAGKRIGVNGLGPSVSEAIVSVTLADGTRASHVVTPSAAAWTFPGASSPIAALRSYARFGLEHIARGPDHLLFLFLLVLILRRPKAVLVAETAFTISHALSFAATALGLLRVSAQAAEVCIALSLVLMALDVGRTKAPPGTTETALLALVFGFVHGLGFAGGLREIGLPERDIGAALLGFAAGIEAGQIAFVVLALGATYVVERARAIGPLSLVSSYAAGTLACFWFLQRMWSMLGLSG